MDNQETSNPQQVNPQFNQQFGQQQLPNSTAVLVLGIISIVSCFCYGLVGIILGIIAIILAGKGETLYQLNPNFYTISSYKNLKAGKICAIVGLSLSAIYFICIMVWLAIWGAAIASFPWQMIGR